MAPLRALLGTLGTGLALLGRSGTLLGHSLALLGQSWAALGDQLFDCGRSWGKFWPSRASRGCLQSCSGQLFNPKILQILLPSNPPSLHASERPRRVTRSANNPAALALASRRAVLDPHVHASHACCLRFAHAVHAHARSAWHEMPSIFNALLGAPPQDIAQNLDFITFT